jgi:hypothetical protein
MQNSIARSVISSDQRWVNATQVALCDVISMLSAVCQSQPHLSEPVQDIPHANSRVIQLISEALGGHAKGTMVCCVDLQRNGPEEILSALSYAHFYKSIKNFAAPHDIPPELQRLNFQVNRFHTEE